MPARFGEGGAGRHEGLPLSGTADRGAVRYAGAGQSDGAGTSGLRPCRAAEDGVDALFLFGDQAEEYAAGARDGGLEEIRILPDREALAQALLQAAGPGDLIWFKASHSMRLEETIELFYQGLEEQAAK